MILPLEKQVSSLESSKLLRELGFRQDSIFYYLADSLIYEPKEIWHIKELDIPKCEGRELYSAYTSSELGEMLPKVLNGYAIEITPYSTIRWLIRYQQEDYKGFSIEDNYLVEAMSKMLCYLKQNNLI